MMAGFTAANVYKDSPSENDRERQTKGHYARLLKQDEIEKLEKDKFILSDFKQSKLESDARKHWDLFYKRNETKFFKDRHWTKREFEELANGKIGLSEKPALLEIGCGVGNFIFPLIEEGTEYFIHACDFSPRAITFVKENPLYNPQSCSAFVCDITNENLETFITPDSINIATMVFVLSSIHPEKMIFALKNIFKVLQPGGLLLFRDYGLYDQAMLRFKPGHKLRENFYVRQDGTRAFYFSDNFIGQLAVQAGYEVLMNNYITRETVNRKEGLCVPRIYIQAKFRKPNMH